MTSTQLHPTPNARAVVTEQFRAVGLAVRTEAYFYLGALLVIAILVIVSTIRSVHMFPASSHHSFVYGVGVPVPIQVIAFLIPFGVWRSEDPARRAYHWTMPVARGPHTIVKFLCGWAWLMFATVVYLLSVVLLAVGISLITGEPNRVATGAGWEWLVAFTAPTILYLLASIAVIGSDHAWRWIGGLFLAFWVLIGVSASFGLPELSLALRSIWDGAYGLRTALVGLENKDGPIMNSWLVAMPLWIIGSAIAVTIASYRHRE
ncbi:MAG: hypothetical protein ABI311_00040 [Gemmatimonadaceae bacterium]